MLALASILRAFKINCIVRSQATVTLAHFFRKMLPRKRIGQLKLHDFGYLLFFNHISQMDSLQLQLSLQRAR